MPTLSPDQQLNDWLTAFSSATSRHDIDAAMRLFVSDAFWRDLAAFTWNISTVEGRDAIRTREQDALFYEQLRQADFLVTFGEDEAGILPQILRNPSGYYMDVGAFELIINGQIKVRSDVGVEALGEDSIILTDGSELPADMVVYATGFDRNPALAMLPDDIAGKVGRIWGFGSGLRNDPGPWEGELRNMWKPTAQTGLWFHSHGVGGSRFYSRLLALQIKARHAGLPTPVYRDPAILQAGRHE